MSDISTSPAQSNVGTFSLLITIPVSEQSKLIEIKRRIGFNELPCFSPDSIVNQAFGTAELNTAHVLLVALIDLSIDDFVLKLMILKFMIHKIKCL